MTLYTKDFFAARQPQVRHAANTIIALVFEYIQPQSVVDIGCGTGEFLAAAQEHGALDILGIDGDYVDRTRLALPQHCFQVRDLNLPFTLERVYDLALCLEVGEHLAPSYAHDFVASLTHAAPIVLFSAAIPYQGGTGHVNEQWPDYWAGLFKEHGYVPVDALRGRLWHRQDIPFWYRQNILFFCAEQALAQHEKLAEASRLTSPAMLSLVHPELYLKHLQGPDMRLKRSIKAFLHVIRKAARRE